MTHRSCYFTFYLLLYQKFRTYLIYQDNHNSFYLKYLLSINSYSIRGKTCWSSSVVDGRSDGLGDIKGCNKDSCSGNPATQSEGSSPLCFISDRTTCHSIAVLNGCQSSRNTIPKLYMSACQNRPMRL